MTTWRTYYFTGTTTFTWTLIHGEPVTCTAPVGDAPLEDRHTARSVDYIWVDGRETGWLIRWRDGREQRIDKVNVSGYHFQADIREGEPVTA